MQPQTGTAAQHPGQREIADAGVQRPSTAALGAAAAEQQVGLTVGDPAYEGGEQAGVEGAVAVAEADELRLGGEQSGMAGGAEAASLLVHDGGAERAGQLGRSVGGAVVDDDRAPAVRDGVQHPGQCRGLVQTGQDDIGIRRRDAGVRRARQGGVGHAAHPTEQKPTFRAPFSYEKWTSAR